MIDRSMTGYRAESLLSSSFAINNRINVRFLWNRLAMFLAMIQSTSLREKHRRVNVNRVFARFLLTFYRLGHLSRNKTLFVRDTYISTDLYFVNIERKGNLG